MNSFQVCVGHIDSGLLLICPSSDSGEFGPVADYFFTENHLLIKTFGAKLSQDFPGKYTTDPDQQHYFILDKKINDPYTHKLTGPLDSDQFFAHEAVPSEYEWKSPTNPGFLEPLMGVFLILGLAIIIHGWPIILVIICVLVFLVVRRMCRVSKEKKLKNA